MLRQFIPIVSTMYITSMNRWLICRVPATRCFATSVKAFKEHPNRVVSVFYPFICAVVLFSHAVDTVCAK